MPEMTETQTPGHKPKRKKNKESHNADERHRKEKINAGITRIGSLLPCCQSLKQSKNMILDQAFRYITELKKQNDTMLLEGGDKAQAEEIRRLRRQLEELRKSSAHYIELLKAHDINFLEDPTIHWKGKQRCAQVATVIPTHQLPKEIACPNDNRSHPPAKPNAETLIVQPAVEARLNVNGTVLQMDASSSIPALLPGSAATPAQSTPGLRVMEQCVIDTGHTLPPSVSYITLQIPAANTATPQQTQPATLQTLTVSATSASQLLNQSSAQPTIVQPITFPQTVDKAVAAEVLSSISQDLCNRTVNYPTITNSQTLLRAGAAGSTQTTWTTLQMAGNTVQPVCQSLTSELNNTQAVQHISAYPANDKASTHPIQIQMQSHVPVQQASITAHVQAQPLQSQPQSHPGVANQTHPQSVLTHQPQCGVLPQSAVVPPSAVVAHAAVVSQVQPVLQQGPLVPHPTTAIIPQPLPQPSVVQQSQATVLPLLQTMQVLQVNPSSLPASGVTASQNTNNASVVILQQANACPTQPILRDDMNSHTPCQHIVIIQAPNQPPAATQNPQTSIAPNSISAVSAQTSAISSTMSSAPIQSVGGKQLVHILPRPVHSQVSNSSSTSQMSSSQPASTITVNGQVFALQPVKTSDKVGSQGGHSTLQLVQPSTTEEPTTNVALRSLGALSSLNQSISKGLPLSISAQNNSQPPPVSLSAVQMKQQQQPSASTPVSETVLSYPAQKTRVLKPGRSGLAANSLTLSTKRVRTALSTKRATAKRTKPIRKKEPNLVQPAVVPDKSTSGGGEGETQTAPVSQSVVVKVSNAHPICSTVSTTISNSDTSTSVTLAQSTTPLIVSCTSKSTIVVNPSNPQDKGTICLTSSDPVNNKKRISGTCTTATTTLVGTSASVTLAVGSTAVAVSSSKSTETKPCCSESQPVTMCATASKVHVDTAAVSSVSTNTSTSAAASSVAGSTTLVSSITSTSSSQKPITSTVRPCPQESINPNLPTCTKLESLPSPSVSTAVSSPNSKFSTTLSSIPTPTPNTDFRKRIPPSAVSSQQVDMTIPTPMPTCQQAQEKLQPLTRCEKETQGGKHSFTAERENTRTMTSDSPSKKSYAVSEQVYTNLDEQNDEHPISTSRQTDSPSSTSSGSGRVFSVASMLPQGHGVGASSSSFGTFTFTSEQAEMLAMAMLEQDNSGKRNSSCSGGNTSSVSSVTDSWEPAKASSASAGKERGSTEQQTKATKAMDLGAAKPMVGMTARGQTGEVAVAGNATQLPQNVGYAQSQPLSQAQPQSSAQSETAASLSINNLIRSNSGHQTYPGSPAIVGQQGSVPPPLSSSTHVAQSINNAMSPCSGAVQDEYKKNAMMRTQPGAGMVERHVKIISKRQTQEEAILNTAKRPKPCPPPPSHIDGKAPDHSQMMVQLPSTSTVVTTRVNSEAGGPLFSSNQFSSPSVCPTDVRCPAQVSAEHNHSGVLHLPQGHPQHAVSQNSQHLGGNVYMKQQHEQQRHHLYHLQHQMTQPDPAQRLSLHQRALQQQEQQQHVQKKRGIVRANQSGSPATLQSKQHHLEKSAVQQHPHQQQQQQIQHQQHQQQPHQQSQQHPQSQHQQQPHQQPSQAHQQQQLQQQQQQQSSHSRHPQHMQQQIQQQQQHFRHQDKSCDVQTGGSRVHHSNHLTQQDHLKGGPDHSGMQRMMSSRSLEQQLISSPSHPVSRSSDLTCASSRQERHRVSNYSAEALIGKTSSAGEQQQRMALHLQPGRSGSQEQPDLRGYLEAPRGKTSIQHNPQNRLPSEHPGSADVQRISECAPFKVMSGGGGTHQLTGFEAQVSRGNEMAPKSVAPSQRGPQPQQQTGFRMSVGPGTDNRNRGSYSGAHSGQQGTQVGPALPREQESCHQSFMQSLLSPHLPEQTNHQRSVQCCPPVSMEYSCVPGSSSSDIQAKVSSPSVPHTQKAPPAMRLAESHKGHIPQVTGNLHAGPGVRAGHAHPSTPHSSSEQGRSSAPSRPLPAGSQHSRHITRESQPPKLRPGERLRSAPLRTTNPFEPESHLPLPSGGGVLLSRSQSGGEARRSTIVRFMPDGAQAPDNNLVADQHLTQNFGFPFIPEGGMNPPPPINANSTFIPPVSQPSTSRTPSLLPVEPQNTLPSFYPPYTPATHPSLPSDVTLQYFPNQMFTSPSADKASAPPLNNRFSSILSPPRPVGFAQASFPLLPDMPPMPIANSSSITPHISNFSLTSLFPEITSGMSTDGSAMPMSPLLSLSNASSADSGKQTNRPAHNISHILGHDGSSAV